MGVDGIGLVPIRRRPRQDPHEKAKADSQVLSSIRAAVEHAVAHVKTWRTLSQEDGRFHPSTAKSAETLAAINGLTNLTPPGRFAVNYP